MFRGDPAGRAPRAHLRRLLVSALLPSVVGASGLLAHSPARAQAEAPAAAPTEPAPAEAKAAPAEAEPTSVESAPPRTESEPQSEPQSEAVPPESPPPAAASNTRARLLAAELAQAEADRPSTVLPWIATGLGVAAVLTGAVAGAIHVATCDGSCPTSALWSWLQIGGCTVTSAGTVWLVLATRDQAEARHRVDRAREELERDRVDRSAPQAAARPTTIQLRATF